MKQILVTGASSGIGKAIVRYLAEEGYRLFMVARSEEKLRSLLTELGDKHGYFVCDLSDDRNADAVAKAAAEQGFVFDGMVYSAGVFSIERFNRIDMEKLDYFMRINCYGFIALTKALYRQKLLSDGGSIVAMSSLSTMTNLPGTLIYSMTKNALNSACATMSKELLRRKIRVNTIMPATVNTPMNDGNIMDLDTVQPLGLIEPTEVAMLAEFLLSDKSKKITGANIPISAGMRY